MFWSLPSPLEAAASTLEGRETWCGWPEQGNINIGGKENEEAARER